MAQELIIELSDKTKTTILKYADKPLKLGGIPQEITIEELNKKVSKSFTYSDALYSKEKHPPYYKNANNKDRFKNDTEKKFEQLGFTDTSFFVVCNMGRLGHGVFADRDFEPGECFILYSGVITDKNQSEEIGDYAFSINKELTLCVDANKIGNISRFIQHMPLNFDLYDKHAKSDSSYHKIVPEYDKNSPDYWEWRNIVYKSGLTEDDIAWANMALIVVPIQGVPNIVMYNTRRINKGDQLGISYGSGYWIRRKRRSELFDLKGNIIPTSHYSYKEAVVNIPTIELFNQFPQFKNIGVTKSYTAAMFQKDLQRQEDLLQPVWFSHMAEPVSLFELRELLLEFNVIGKEYEAVEKQFISELRDTLPKEFKIKMYVRDPQQNSTKPIYDVVCTTDDLMKWSQLTAFIKNPKIASFNIQNKCLKLTQEVIFMDIGSREKQLTLLTILRLAKSQGIFSTPLESAYIPSGPTRRDPNGIIKAQRKEAIEQIIFHNPGLTKQEIENSYNTIESTFNPAVKPNKDVQLNFSTFSFFQFNLPAKWSIYPSDKLKGKYIGHQVRFFNLPIQYSSRAEPFLEKLKQEGFDAELKSSGDKPSIVVDLTTSKQM